MAAKIVVLMIAALYVATTSAYDQLDACTCTRDYTPVCGSDGHTYGNKCVLNCEISKGADLTLAKEGPCGDAPLVCICDLSWNPVCTNDGQTLPNECVFDCEKAKNAALEIASRGQCSGEAENVINEQDRKDEVKVMTPKEQVKVATP